MTAEKKDRKPLQIKNLADLKRHIRLGTELVATAHQTESADAGTDGGNSDEGLLRHDPARLREILIRPLCCWRQLPICVGYPRISPFH